MVVFQCDPGVNCALVKMIQLLQPVEHVVLDSLGESDIVRR